MEIIEEGQLPDEQIHEGRCTNCGCKVSFKRSEATFHTSPRNEEWLAVKCPTINCRSDILSFLTPIGPGFSPIC